MCALCSNIFCLQHGATWLALIGISCSEASSDIFNTVIHFFVVEIFFCAEKAQKLFSRIQLYNASFLKSIENEHIEPKLFYATNYKMKKANYGKITIVFWLSTFSCKMFGDNEILMTIAYIYISNLLKLEIELFASL